MLVVGLTGGIGSGKSTLAALLMERGAQVIDADELGRDALRTGRPAWHSVVDQFGDEILVPDSMEVDRGRLADIVFHDEARRRALNAIVHPVIVKGIADRLEELAETDEIVVLDAALILEAGLSDAVDVLVVVVASDELRTRRLQRERRMSAADIAARMAAQTDQTELAKAADVVVVNDGSLDDLVIEAERVWSELERRRGS
jgi:dephospho-CoA kinase